VEISIFVTIWSMALSPGDVQRHILGDPLDFLAAEEAVVAVELYQSETGDNLPPLHDVPAPTSMVEIRVGSADAAKELVESDNFKQLLLNKQAFSAPVEKIDLEILEPVHYPIPGQATPPPRTAPLSFVVRYYGPVENQADFVEFYTTNHPPLLAEFPGIRNVLCYLPLGWRDTQEITDSSVIIGNEVVFDDLDSLNRALASDALGPVMADSEKFASYGVSTHYVMQRELIYQRD